MPARSASKTSCRVRTSTLQTAPAYRSFPVLTGNAVAAISSLAFTYLYSLTDETVEGSGDADLQGQLTAGQVERVDVGDEETVRVG